MLTFQFSKLLYYTCRIEELNIIRNYIIYYFTIIYHEIYKGRMDSEGRIKETRDITTAMKRTSVYKTRGNLIS